MPKFTLSKYLSSERDPNVGAKVDINELVSELQKRNNANTDAQGAYQ